MTRDDVIAELDRIRWALSKVLNEAYVSGALNEQGKLWLGSSIYGINGVIAGLEKEAAAELEETA